MHARGPGAVERLQESAAMIANYPARGLYVNPLRSFQFPSSSPNPMQKGPSALIRVHIASPQISC